MKHCEPIQKAGQVSFRDEVKILATIQNSFNVVYQWPFGVAAVAATSMAAWAGWQWWTGREFAVEGRTTVATACQH